MSTRPQSPELADLPSAVPVAKKPWALQLIWIIPILAILVGINLAYKTATDHGPTITISFNSGDGLEPGKTLVKYKGIKIGLIQDVSISPDRKHAIATIQLDKEASDFAREGTQFWIVRPRISTSGVSGLDTLLSGPFIAADISNSSTPQTRFVALEVPPILTAGLSGSEFVLKSPTLGSHDIGTQVFFRRLAVGEVIAHELDPSGQEISIKIFVHAPYDRYVTADTRFWNASGVDVTLGTGGLQVQTESLVAVLVGGIAFESFRRGETLTIDESGLLGAARSSKDVEVITPSEPAPAGSVFPLFQTRALAMRQPEPDRLRFTVDFKQSVKGLSIGAPVEFRGVHVGEVISIGLAFNPKTFEIIQPVEITFYPERLVARSLITGEMIPVPATRAELLARMKEFIDRGLRAQLRLGSILTEKQYIGIDIFPNAPKYNVDISKYPMVLQSVPSLFDDLENSFGGLLKTAEKVLKRIDTELIPSLNHTLRNVSAVTANDSPLQLDIRNSLREITRAAASIKALTDMLDDQPQSVLFGKPPENSKK